MQDEVYELIDKAVNGGKSIGNVNYGWVYRI